MTELTQQERQNVAVVNRYLEEVWNAGNLNAVDELLAQEYVHGTPAPGMPPGREGLKQFIAMMRAALPDLSHSVDDTIAHGDKVVQRSTARGTHKGELMGVPPTGTGVTIEGISIYQVIGGKIAKEWTIVDRLGLMQQIGAALEPRRYR